MMNWLVGVFVVGTIVLGDPGFPTDPAEHARWDHSRVYTGGSQCTLMGVLMYYDEEGKLHYDDPNTCTTTYRCSKGHEWAH